MSTKRATSYIAYYFKPHNPIQVLPESTTLGTYVKKWMFNHYGYNQLGLYHDDLLYEFPDVKEAVRRLPESLKLERNWRCLQAVQLDLNHEILPEQEWISYEDDITKGRYLQPYLEEVRKEIQEKDRWNSMY